jgi:formylglycine-generating enzyme required for sulfatase activity
MEKTGGDQVPWTEDGIQRRERVSFGGAAPTAMQALMGEVAQVWATVKDTTSVAALDAFARRFGGSVYADMAKARIEELKSTQVAVAVPPPRAPDPAPKKNEPASQQPLPKQLQPFGDQKLGQSFRDCDDGCPEMVAIPVGEFTMGSNVSDAEKPPHKVTFQTSFAVGKYEVTFDDWDACFAAKGCSHNPEARGARGRLPVVNVSWNDAKEYTSWLSRKTGKNYRLLSEAEWEYAARANTLTRFSFGDGEAQLSSYAWYSTNSGARTHPVGAKLPNAFGLYDMHGNVWEWCEDAWHPNYIGAPVDGSVWSNGGMASRVLRGGSWVIDPDVLRSSVRYHLPAITRDASVGFRLARTL